MSKELLPPGEGKDDALTRITRFMTDGDVVLSADEDRILSRLVFADALLRGRKFTEDQILQQVKLKYGVSKHTARNDLYKAMALFETARQYSKRYLVWEHVQDIRLTIEQAKTDKSLRAVLPKLYDSLTSALKLLPEHQRQELPSVTQIHFHAAPGQSVQSEVPFEEAQRQAREMLAARNKQPVFTEFEEVDDERDPN